MNVFPDGPIPVIWIITSPSFVHVTAAPDLPACVRVGMNPRGTTGRALSAIPIGRHAHLQRSFDQSSSASRFTAGASEFFILSQSGERPER
jgi:hypothetical protein